MLNFTAFQWPTTADRQAKNTYIMLDTGSRLFGGNHACFLWVFFILYFVYVYLYRLSQTFDLTSSG